MGEGVGLAVALGLLVGKPLGIVLFSALAVRTGLAALPDGVGWSALAGAGLLAGIGFTMALFIAELALEGAVLDEAKLGVLAGSVLSGVLGLVLLRSVLRPPAGPASAGT
jgi:NhaA family Na+:H+ antiporter